MTMIHILVTGGLFILALFGVTKTQAISYLYGVYVKKGGIDFLILQILRIHHLPFFNIDYVKQLEIGGHRFVFAMNFKNRPFSPVFLIHKKRAWYAKDVLITPSDGSAFEKQLHEAGISFK